MSLVSKLKMVNKFLNKILMVIIYLISDHEKHKMQLKFTSIEYYYTRLNESASLPDYIVYL